MSNHLLIVDDDPELRQLLCDYLSQNTYRVSAVADGHQMWRKLEQSRINLIVLDLMLPGDDGLVLCRNLRARSTIPVIMLTARGETTDRIIGLEMGADDYLAKPFEPRELLARVRALLRRSQALPAAPEDIRRYRFASWTLDVAARDLTSPDGVATPLSRGEYRLLKVFLEHPQRVLSRDQLLDLTQGEEAVPFDRSIDMQVSRLRRRLGDDSREPELIKTIRAEGYMLATPVNGDT